MKIWDNIRFLTGSEETKLSILQKELNKEFEGIGVINNIKVSKSEYVYIEAQLGTDEQAIEFSAKIFELNFHTGDELFVTYKYFSINPNWIEALVYKIIDKQNVFFIDEKNRKLINSIKQLFQDEDKISEDYSKIEEELEKQRVDIVNPEEFNDQGFLSRARNIAKNVGKLLLEKAFILFYCWKDEDTPTWAKATIVSALVYFISPVDAIPDTIPVAGFADDALVIAGAIKTVHRSIKEEHKQLAKEKVEQLLNR